MPSPSRLRPLALAAALAAAALGLAGCVHDDFPLTPSSSGTPTAPGDGTGTPTGSGSPTASGTPSAPASPTPPPSESPTAPPADAATPIGKTCDDLLSLQSLYDYNPNVSRNDGAVPPAGSHAAAAVAAKGIACAVVNNTSGETVWLGASIPGQAAIDATLAGAGETSLRLADGTPFSVLLGAVLITAEGPSVDFSADVRDLAIAGWGPTD